MPGVMKHYAEIIFELKPETRTNPTKKPILVCGYIRDRAFYGYTDGAKKATNFIDHDHIGGIYVIKDQKYTKISVDTFLSVFGDLWKISSTR